MEEISNSNSPFSIDEDRISSLPEPLIHHILSFLDLKSVVRTSFLSTRWRYVWTSVSDLVFKSNEFYGDYQPDEDEDEDVDPFGRFVDSVLKLRGISDIKRFNLYNVLYGPDRFRDKRIKTWIHTVVRRNVQELGLWLDNDSTIILQTLVIREIGGPVGDELNVKNRELKHLEINYRYYDSDSVPRIIRLCTPSLTSFICEDYMKREYCLEDLSSLVAANIKLRSKHWQERQFPMRTVLVFLMAIHNVKELTLWMDFLQVLSGAPNSIDCLPQLRNLRCLKLKMQFSSCYLLALTYLLTILPCLESLFITSKEPDSEDDRELVLSGSCKLSHLKYIEIREVKGCKNELIFLECVLKNAPVLEEMVLYFRSAGSSTSLDTKGRRDILNARKKFGEKIKALPRVSPCFIMIFS